MPPRLTRRRALAALLGGGASLLAGCSSDATGPTNSTDTPGPTTQRRTDGRRECPTGTVEPDAADGSVSVAHDLDGPSVEHLRAAADHFDTTYGPSATTRSVPDRQFRMMDRIDWLRTSGVSVLVGNATLAPELDRAQLLADGQRIVDPCRYEATARAAATRTGQLAGYPLSTVTAGLFYDVETLDAWGVEPPRTVAELATLAERAHDPDAGAYGVAAALDAFALSGYARAYGADIYDAEAESLGIEDDDLRRGLAAVVEAIAPYLPPELDRESQLSAFRSGETPFYLGPSSALAELTERDGPVGAAPLPMPEGGTPRPYATTTCCYVLDTDTESEADVTASEQFGAWLSTNAERLRPLSNDRGALPANRSLVGDDALSRPIRSLSAGLDTAVPVPADQRMDAVWNPITSAVRAAVSGETELDDALDRAASDVRAQWSADTSA